MIDNDTNMAMAQNVRLRQIKPSKFDSGFDDDDKIREEVVFDIEGPLPWDEESGSLLKYGCYKDKKQILGSETIHEFPDHHKTMQVRFEVQEAGTYKFVAKYDSVHVDGSPLSFPIGKQKSKLTLIEPASQISICSPISKSSTINLMDRIATEDDSWSPSDNNVGVAQSKFKFEEKNHNVAIVQPSKLSSIFGKSLSISEGKDIHTDFTKVKIWKKVMMIPRVDIDNPMGLCVPTDNFFVSSKSESRVLMFNLSGKLQKELQNGREGFNKPSDMVALRNGTFAIRSNSYVVTMDSQGRKINTIWEGKGGMKCFGLAQDDSGNLACLHETRDQTFLKLFDPGNGKEKQNIDITDIIQDRNRTMCRFLTYKEGRFYVTDLGMDKIYVVDENTGDARAFGQSGRGPGQFSDPAGLVADSQGNMMVADSKNHRLCLFNKDRKYIRDVKLDPPVSRPSAVVMDYQRGELYALNLWGRYSVVKYTPG